MEVEGLVTVLSAFVSSLSSKLSEVLGGPSDHARLSETIERKVAFRTVSLLSCWGLSLHPKTPETRRLGIPFKHS